MKTPRVSGPSRWWPGKVHLWSPFGAHPMINASLLLHDEEDCALLVSNHQELVHDSAGNNLTIPHESRYLFPDDFATPTCLAWSAEETLPLGVLAVSTIRGSVLLFNAASFLIKFPATPSLEPFQTTHLVAPPEPIFNLSFGRGNNCLAGSSLYNVLLWDVSSGTKLITTKSKPLGGYGLQWAEANNLLYSSNEDIHFLDIRSRREDRLGIQNAPCWDDDQLIGDSHLLVCPHNVCQPSSKGSIKNLPSKAFSELWDLRFPSGYFSNIKTTEHTLRASWSPLINTILLCNTKNKLTEVDVGTIAKKWKKTLHSTSDHEINDITWSNHHPTMFSSLVDGRQISLHTTIQEGALPTVTEREENSPISTTSTCWEPYSEFPLTTKPPPHIHRIQFSTLTSDRPEIREAAIAMLKESMHISSYCVIGMTRDQKELIHLSTQIQQEFYNLPSHLKQEIEIGPGRDIGYKNTPDVKEFFQMRLNDVDEMPWPRKPEMITALWHQLDNISRVVMSCLAVALELPENTFEQFMDPRIMPHNQFSHSIMGMYNYYAHEQATTTCLVHKDMGLISLIPCAAIPGLEVLDTSSYQWVQIEKWASKDVDLCIIGGQTLERITGGFYPGNIHRVVGTKSRQSIVFKMRAPANAIIDTENLGSERLRNIAHIGNFKKETVEDWMTNELIGRDSVNFPGKSKENYHNIVLSPNINISIKDKFSGRTIGRTSANNLSYLY